MDGTGWLSQKRRTCRESPKAKRMEGSNLEREEKESRKEYIDNRERMVNIFSLQTIHTLVPIQ
jgi:CRISPR/Cas system CMR subunit Cmr6 (Cas7 group RAMP superfamily)